MHTYNRFFQLLCIQVLLTHLFQVFLFQVLLTQLFLVLLPQLLLKRNAPNFVFCYDLISTRCYNFCS